ncbi:MAG: response regulator [Gammaproteobacteria bacterium]|nr:response regulator [Gammaproteobacteria bacterium]MDH5694577.1 response regulator [Gammaproteobacteria bacterium]
MAKILTVDDSKTMVELIKATLEGKGHQVWTALSGREALQIAEEETFDLIFCDVNMPEMTGISLVSQLRKKPGFEFVPIIMVTTESGDYKKTKARTMGASGWLQKPFTPDRLLGAVKKLVG